MQEMNVGVIGNGFVGNSLYHTFSPQFTVRVYDVIPEKSTHTLEEVIDESDIIFVCVPTPMKADGHIDLSYIENVFQQSRVIIDGLFLNEDELVNKVFIIKSTVVPGTTGQLSEKYNLTMGFSPEFLTERTAVSDSLCSNHTIVGGHPIARYTLQALYKKRFGAAHNVFQPNVNTAEFIKYMRNCYFATKVTFMNEMYKIAENMDVDWDAAVSGFALDGRVSHSHLQVPGHDGKFGFGGTCFPKDINAIIQASNDYDYYPLFLAQVEFLNRRFRKEEDWTSQVGRAVSE